MSKFVDMKSAISLGWPQQQVMPPAQRPLVLTAVSVQLTAPYLFTQIQPRMPPVTTTLAPPQPKWRAWGKNSKMCWNARDMCLFFSLSLSLVQFRHFRSPSCKLQTHEAQTIPRRAASCERDRNKGQGHKLRWKWVQISTLDAQPRYIHSKRIFFQTLRNAHSRNRKQSTTKSKGRAQLTSKMRWDKKTSYFP